MDTSSGKILEPPRLLLREAIPADAEDFYLLNSHPDVMRYVGEDPWESVEQARERILAYPDFRERGFGRWAVVHKPENRVIGFNGLKYLEDLDEVDLGYRFLPEYWGKGIAAESSRAVLEYGFQDLAMEKIIALVLPENLRSIRLLRKLGMQRQGEKICFGLSAEYWFLTREMYDSRQ